jgi:hypothetical protein
MTVIDATATGKLIQNIVDFVQAGDKNKPLLVIDPGNELLIPALKGMFTPIATLGK